MSRGIGNLMLATTRIVRAHPDLRRNPERFATLLESSRTRKARLVDSPSLADASDLLGALFPPLQDIHETPRE